MIHSFANGVTRIAEMFMWLAFLILIGVVALQVVTRNILHLPMIWTSDVAQLLFVWLVFVGAAVGLRRGAHYTVDVLPVGHPAVRAVLTVVSILAALAVVYILTWHGWTLARIRSTATVSSLGISRFWMFLPMPVSGVMMLIFIVEAPSRLLAVTQGREVE